MQNITPFLWFNNNAEEAMDFYKSVFQDFKAGDISRYPEGGSMPAGMVSSATFTINGQNFMALNGGPGFEFTEAISFFVSVQTQAEVDELWDTLTADGGQESRCGWLKDKFGLSWQIVPTALGKFLGDADRDKARRAMEAMMGMKKIVIADLEAAFNG